MSFLRVVKGLIPRFLFIVHSFSVVWGVATFTQNSYYWMLIGAVVFIVFESGWMIKRKGREYTWFCPSYFCYLCAVVPPIWILELRRLERYRNNEGEAPSNDTETRLQSVFGLTVPVEFTSDMWVLIFEQTMLFLLILARWMLPKGNISRGQLSQLLFVYIALGSDIMELFELFEYTKVVNDVILCYLVLIAWSVSLMQFTLILTATKARKDRVVHALDDDEDDEHSQCLCCETEIWSVLMTMFMQDGPFLGLRVFTMYRHNLLNNGILFFTFKNGLVILVTIYRLIIIGLEHKADRKKKRIEKRKMKETLAFVGPYVSNTKFVGIDPEKLEIGVLDTVDAGNNEKPNNEQTNKDEVSQETVTDKDNKDNVTATPNNNEVMSDNKTNVKPAKGLEKNKAKPKKKKANKSNDIETVGQYKTSDTLTRVVRDSSQMLAGTALPKGTTATYVQYET